MEEQVRLVELNYQTVELVIDWFRAHPEAMRTEGLFRVPGRLLAMQEMWNNVLEKGATAACLGRKDLPLLLFFLFHRRVACAEEQSVEDIGGLLKMCLRNVTSPVFPFETFEAVCGLNPDDKGFSKAISEIVQKSFSPQGKAVLLKLLEFLRDTSKFEEHNKVIRNQL